MYIRAKRPDELMHYGVLGMKWGVHKDPKKATEKAFNKLGKIDAKIQKIATSNRYNVDQMKKKKYEMKIAKYAYKGNNYKKMKFEKKLNKMTARTAKKEYKIMKLSRKGHKWYGKMDKILGENLNSVSAEQKALGKKYAMEFITINGQVIPIGK